MHRVTMASEPTLWPVPRKACADAANAGDAAGPGIATPAGAGLLALAVLMAGCTAVPMHRAPAADTPSAELTVVMDEPPYDRAMSEMMRSFSADLFEPAACKASARLVSMTQDRPQGRWVSRDEGPTPVPRGPIDMSLEFRDAAMFTTRVPAGAPTRISLYGHRMGQQYLGVVTRTFTRRCHAVIEFKPEPGAAYVARMGWYAASCGAVVLPADGLAPPTASAAASGPANAPGIGAALAGRSEVPGGVSSMRAAARVPQTRVCLERVEASR